MILTGEPVVMSGGPADGEKRVIATGSNSFEYRQLEPVPLDHLDDSSEIIPTVVHTYRRTDRTDDGCVIYEYRGQSKG